VEKLNSFTQLYKHTFVNKNFKFFGLSIEKRCILGVKNLNSWIFHLENPSYPHLHTHYYINIIILLK